MVNGIMEASKDRRKKMLREESKQMSFYSSLAETLGQLNPIRYRGYYYDSESSYYYLQSRYYDPELRRFINADKLEGLRSPKNTYLYADSVNTFAYCDNSPVNMVDYSGEKEADNTSNYLANALVFSIGLISYDKAVKIKLDKYSTGSLYKDSKKGKIEVHLTFKKNKVMLSDYMKSFKSVLGNKVYDGLAAFCLEKFYDDFADKFNYEYGTDIIKRPFLFSKSCVSYEIQRRDEVYRTCRNTNKTGVLSDYVAKTLVELSKFLTSKGATVDILEQDVLKSFDESTFNYYDGIASCYQKTKADPYWNGTERDEDYTRPKWKKTRIPYNP